MKRKKERHPIQNIRKKVPPPGFDMNDKSKYNRRKKHKNQEEQQQQ